ncbi:MAG: hypothetical protein JXR31_15380 [Prolixibacteraceae bacterium]|nr:hypothetical protein [Prolixibacteraceae bacterium]MBN2775635.1 hypothetical protein [Prolixibacteraceae bacterium]
MYRLYKHIALYLLGIFIFPVIFQSVHIIVHQSHRCHGTCYLHKHEENSCLLPGQNADKSVFEVKKDKCPICSYEFSTNTISEVTIFKTYIPSATEYFNKGKVVRIKQPLFHKKSPRAPPVIFV